MCIQLICLEWQQPNVTICFITCFWYAFFFPYASPRGAGFHYRKITEHFWYALTVRISQKSESNSFPKAFAMAAFLIMYSIYFGVLLIYRAFLIIYSIYFGVLLIYRDL